MPAPASQNISPSPQGSKPQGTLLQCQISSGRIPQCTEGSSQLLGINSTLTDLPLYRFSVTADHSIKSLLEQFSQMPNLPGVIISEMDRISVLSRQQLLEGWLKLSYAGSNEDLNPDTDRDGPICMMLKYANSKAFTLSGHTSILIGAQQALKRAHKQQNDPILIEQDNDFFLLDARTLNVAHWQIRGIETQIRYERLQLQLLQSEKMAALGRLVDGVAHEILDPVSFIWGNLGYIENYVKQQQQVISAYETALPDPPAEITEIKETIEFDYLCSDLPAALKSTRSGAHRLRQLATSLQNFCHIDDVHPRPSDLNTLLDSTLRLLKSRLSSPIELKRCYGKLPPIPCFAGQLSQVFMTLFTNAIDSLLAQAQLESYLSDNGVSLSGKVPQITVTTCVRAAQEVPTSHPDESRWVSIIISDNGPGLPPATKAQIMDSFSTQRRSLKETGLTMSYQIITAKHGGRFWMRSFHASEYASESIDTQGGQFATGTEFEILLPLTAANDA
jgi:signal transduction histidine kinase